MKLICKNCKKEFHKAPSQIKAGEGKYCSKKCYNQAMKGNDLFIGKTRGKKKRIRVDVICHHCGKKFKTIPSKVRKYCSRSCYLKSHKAKVKNARYWRDSKQYKEWRLQVYKRDGFKCQLCGQIGKNLQAHHIITLVEDFTRIFDIDNGITLCKKCHKLVHKLNKPKRKSGELLGRPNGIISSQALVGIQEKVQRLTAEARPASNADTSAATERYDIVRACG